MSRYAMERSTGRRKIAMLALLVALLSLQGESFRGAWPIPRHILAAKAVATTKSRTGRRTLPLLPPPLDVESAESTVPASTKPTSPESVAVPPPPTALHEGAEGVDSTVMDCLLTESGEIAECTPRKHGNKRLVVGVGINDANYVVKKCAKVDGKQTLVFFCPYYVRWHEMLHRCYSPNVRSVCCLGHEVCPEWLRFSNFRAWMAQYDGVWEGRDLDKTILNRRNTVYSPETCVFVPREVHTLLNGCRNDDAGRLRKASDLPLGVCILRQRKKPVFPPRFQANICINGVQQHLGSFPTMEEAHAVYMKAKGMRILEVSRSLLRGPLDGPTRRALERIARTEFLAVASELGLAEP